MLSIHKHMSTNEAIRNMLIIFSVLSLLLHMVPKTSGAWRYYPAPHIQDFAANIEGAHIFSKIDLVQGYHHIFRRDQNDNYHFFRVVRVRTFQQSSMNTVCQDLDFVFVPLTVPGSVQLVY